MIAGYVLLTFQSNRIDVVRARMGVAKKMDMVLYEDLGPVRRAHAPRSSASYVY
jgi:hypothetical protein